MATLSLPDLGRKISKKVNPKKPKQSIKQVRKRDGSLEKFKPEKIRNAILKAFVATKRKNGKVAQKMALQVTNILEKRFAGKIPHVENIQDVVEESLIKAGYSKVAKAYILYRQKRAELRAARAMLGVKGKLALSLNALTVLQKRYLLRDVTGKITESPEQLFERVARVIAAVDKKYGFGAAEIKEREKTFYKMMTSMEFLPNSPTLMNAGAPLGQLAACFVLPIEDSLKSIFKALGDSALIEQSGGGVGYSFSRLRPKGDIVRSTKGIASGPVTFMSIFDAKTNVIKQGGKRRGALMGVLRVDHPDIIEFITAKADPRRLTNFNISVAVTDRFMRAAKRNKTLDLVNPRNGEPVKKVNARDLWDLIVSYAWKTGDPGVLFIDEVNRRNPTRHLGEIEATNPCGEQPLHPYEACNLGSVNLSKMVRRVRGRYEVDWARLRETVREAVHFLDNVIDASNYPIPEITKMVRANRRIGLGVMGFADMLCILGIPYNSGEALKLGKKIMKFVNEEAHRKSSELGRRKGNFSNFKGSLWQKRGYKYMRNATCTTIAPTGTISIIAGCSSGIEPLFAVSFVRNVLEGTRLLEVNKVFERVAKERGFYSEELMSKIAKSGSVAKLSEVPKDVRRVFVTALEISPEVHVRMQAAFQRYTDNAVSKTINFPPEATVAEVKKAFELAHKLRCKGITVYRYGSKPEQVLYIGELERKKRPEAEPYVIAKPETSGWCSNPLCPTP